jgi:hypothetical protein
MTAENYNKAYSELIGFVNRKADKDFIEGYIIGLKVYVGEKITQAEHDRLVNTFLDIPYTYTLVVDCGKPDSIPGLDYLGLKAALQEAYKLSQADYPYLNVFVYDSSGLDISERQDIEELIHSIMEVK